ncbi:hypothetical protein CS347_11850 [Bordetella hinzii]|uniref:Uncharacterized protein n=1 Tax=Bordetella hinzii TaxID=103855 RepID=A0AAN1RY13_9BORD|nr:hypothetical protein CS347_11850 [Bordetella hinzii]
MLLIVWLSLANMDIQGWIWSTTSLDYVEQQFICPGDSLRRSAAGKVSQDRGMNRPIRGTIQEIPKQYLRPARDYIVCMSEMTMIERGIPAFGATTINCHTTLFGITQRDYILN